MHLALLVRCRLDRFALTELFFEHEIWTKECSAVYPTATLAPLLRNHLMALA